MTDNRDDNFNVEIMELLLSGDLELPEAIALHNKLSAQEFKMIKEKKNT